MNPTKYPDDQEDVSIALDLAGATMTAIASLITCLALVEPAELAGAASGSAIIVTILATVQWVRNRRRGITCPPWTPFMAVGGILVAATWLLYATMA